MTAPAPSADELLAHTDWLLQLARALVGDAAAADVVQDTFEVAIKQPPKKEGPIRPWLAGVARNLAKMSLRGKTRRVNRETAAQAIAVTEIPTSEELVERARMQQKVAAIVLELPEALRDVLLLRFFEGMSAAEIARAQGIPGATVRSRLAEALARVRGALDQQHGGDRKRWMALVAPLPMAASSGHGTAAVVGGLLVKTGIKIAITVAVLAIAAFFAGKHFGWFGEKTDAEGPVRISEGSAKPAPKPVTPTAAAPASASRAPEITHDDDPKGTFRIEGQVIDEKDQPIAGAIVAIDSHPTKTIESDVGGNFVFEGLIARDYRIEATGSIGGTYGYAGPARLRLTEKPEPVTLRMREGGLVEIVVTSSDGSAIKGAEVELRSTLTWKATTDEKGVATLRGVGATWGPLVAHATGYAPAAMMMSTSGSPAAPSRVSLTLSKGAALSGKVIDDKGKAIVGARVVATAASEPFPVVDARRDGVETKADGTFSFPTIASGTWRITATYGTLAPTTSAPIAVDGTNAKTGVELVLVAGASIRGVVKDGAGSPVASAEVRVVVRGTTFWRETRQAFTAADGTFFITGLAQRWVNIVASAPSGASPILDIDLALKPHNDITLELVFTQAIAGTVVDSTGQGIGDAQVIAEPVQDGGTAAPLEWTVRGTPETVTDQSGAFRFDAMPDAGRRYRLRAARPGAQESALELARPIDVKPGDMNARIVLSADGVVKGKVALADGTAPASFTVSIGGTYPVPFATADGSFSIPTVAGTHTIVVDGRRFLAAKAKDVTVAEGKPTDVGTITVQPGRSVSGRVLDENRVPVANAKVAAGKLLTGGGAELYIPDESIDAKDATTDDNGYFRIEGFPPNPITIVAGKDKLRSPSIRLPASPDSATIELIVAATTGLDGTITRDGKPLADTIVIANPVGATSSNFFVQTGPDGTFALDALAPGPYVVYPMIGGGGPRPKDMYALRVEVAPMGRTKTTIDATPGTSTVTIDVKTEDGKPAPMAMVFLVAMALDVKTAEQLRDLDQVAINTKDPLAIYMRGAMGGPAEVTTARPGPHSACAMPPPMSPLVDVRCVAVKVAGPKVSATITVPSKWYAGGDPPPGAPAGSGSGSAN